MTGSEYTYAGAPSITQPPELLNLHPGPAGERSVMRWTAPAAGSYVASGRFQGLDNVGTTTDVRVTHNGATLFSGAVTGHGSQAPFAAAFTAAAGDTLEFSVGRGANATYSNDSTGLAATVAPAAAVGAARWLVTDHLGTPRMVVDQVGTLAGVSRHDYLPFGEEMGAGVGGRTAPRGYGDADGVRQKLTGHERDEETGLDFMQARYYGSAAGRFTSVDPLLSSAQPADPQTWNRYAYVLNRPTIAIDPAGLSTIIVSIAPRSRGGDGRATVQVFDRNGHDVKLRGRDTNGFEGKAVGGGPDRTRTGNDTPFGVYKILPNYMGSNANGTQGGELGKSARGKDERYGTGILTLQPVSGEVKDSNRSSIYIHGGPPINEENQELKATEGCVRGQNGDVNALLDTVNYLAENGDPVTQVFMGDIPALNEMADKKDWDGSYLHPQLRNAGFGNEIGSRPPGSVPNTQPGDSLRRPKE